MDQKSTAPADRVVVGVDGSPGARAALDWALAEAARRQSPLEVVAAFPVDFYWIDPLLENPARIEEIRADTERLTRELVTGARAAAGRDVDVTVTVVAGAASEHLVQRSRDAALLVVGSRGRGGVRSTLLGSVALHCAAHAACRVVVVHPGAVAAPARVVVGVDESDTAGAVVRAAAEAAAALGAELHAVTAVTVPDYWTEAYVFEVREFTRMREAAQTAAERLVAEVLGDRPDLRVQVRALDGPPQDVLVRQAAGAALLVVGSRSRSRLAGMVLGSVALHAVVHAPCPVLVVHPDTVPEAGRDTTALAAAGS
ncbi:universal stress protein [Modestobacter sp. NPDC049651]|uniref:universal stress protein n=1 Tax=unclassified Modestobacter TaxID=2643866 RepID=UPI0034090103